MRRYLGKILIAGLSVAALGLCCVSPLWRVLSDRTREAEFDQQRLEVVPAPVPEGTPWITCEGDDAAGWPTRRIDPVGMLALLRARRFTQLTEIVERAAAAREEDVKSEVLEFDALEPFEIVDPSITPLLDAWALASPSSYAPLAARGAHTLALAWERRGGGYSDTISDRARAGMIERASRARQLLRRAAQLAPRSVAVQAFLIKTAQLLGEPREIDASLARAIGVCPACFHVRLAAMRTRTARWYGSAEVLEAMGRAAQAHVAENPSLTVLQAFADVDRCDDARRDGDLPRALELCDRAVSVGTWRTSLIERAGVHEAMGDLEAALRDADQAVALDPRHAGNVLVRARLLRKKHAWAPYARDVLRLARTSPTSEGSAARITTAGRMMTGVAYVRAVLGEPAEARAAAQLALELLPDDDAARALLATRVAGSPELAAAEAHVRAAPDDHAARVELDSALLAHGELFRIVAMWDEFLARHPEDGEAWLEVGGTESRMGPAWSADATAHAGRGCDLGVAQACLLAGRPPR